MPYPHNMETSAEKLRALCLYRVSTGQQVYYNEKHEADIPMQRKACREFCDRMGWEIVYELQEEGVSGHKVRAENRDKIQKSKNWQVQRSLMYCLSSCLTVLAVSQTKRLLWWSG